MGTRAASGELKLTLQATITNTMVDGQPAASATHGGTLISGRRLDGVSENQFSRVWEDISRALASGASEDLDFYDLGSEDIGGGAGRDALGQAIAFEEIVTVVIRQLSGTGRLQINATDPSNKLAWMPTLTVANGGALRNGATFMMDMPGEDALDVADASSHMVRFGASGGDVVYAIYLIGRHDDNESSSSSDSTKSSSSSASSSSTSSISSVSSSSSSSSHSRSSSSTESSSTSSSSNTVSSSSSSSSTLTSSDSSVSSASSSSSSTSSL